MGWEGLSFVAGDDRSDVLVVHTAVQRQTVGG